MLSFGMKDGIHPRLFEVDLITPDGTTKVLSTVNKAIFMTVSKNEHPAWSGKGAVIRNNSKLDKINSFF